MEKLSHIAVNQRCTMEEKHNGDHYEIQIRDMSKTNCREELPTYKKTTENIRQLAHTTSDLGAFLHIIKGSLGTGILAMPYAYKNAGLFMGLIGCFLTGLIVTHTTVILVNCSQRLCRIFDKESLSYASTAEFAFIHGFKGRLKNHADKINWTVNFFLFITYYGVVICYVLLVAETTKQVLEEYTESKFNIRFYTVAVLFLVYPIGIVRLMKYLVPFSAIANIFLTLAICLVFREIFKDVPSLTSQPAVQTPHKWPIFIGMVFLSMEGIGTILPVENEMKNPQRLTHPPGLLYLGMSFVVLLNTLVGFFGYLKYGDQVKGAISLNLPDDWLSQAIKLTIALMVLFTYGLQLTVPVKVILDMISPHFKTSAVGPNIAHDYSIRTICILGSVIVATVLPSLAGVISLIGSVGFSILGIFLPAMIDLACHSENPGFLYWRHTKNVILMLLAIFCGVVGTYCSILEILHL